MFPSVPLLLFSLQYFDTVGWVVTQPTVSKYWRKGIRPVKKLDVGLLVVMI